MDKANHAIVQTIQPEVNWRKPPEKARSTLVSAKALYVTEISRYLSTEYTDLK